MYLTVIPVVRLVLVLAVALVSAGADTYDYNRWGYFQQEPMKSKNDGEMLRVFDKIHTKLTKRGIKPTFQIMDNEASTAVLDWFVKNDIDAQKVSPYNHRANISERMIETAKHHFIAGMAGTDENFPITQWDRCVAQSERSLNMLRPC